MIVSRGTGKIGDFGFSIQLPKVAGGRSMFTAQCFARSSEYTLSDQYMPSRRPIVHVINITCSYLLSRKCKYTLTMPKLYTSLRGPYCPYDNSVG